MGGFLSFVSIWMQLLEMTYQQI